MGSYDGVKVFELKGFYLLSKLTSLVGSENVILYKDGGLAVIHQTNSFSIFALDRQMFDINTAKRFVIEVSAH